MSEQIPLDPAPSDPLEIPGEYIPTKCADVLDLDMEDGLVLFNGVRVSSTTSIRRRPWCGSFVTARGRWNRSALTSRTNTSLTMVLVQEQVGSLVGEFEALGLIEDASQEVG